MKVLDLFCGLGGWSIPFIEDGDDVTGIDIIAVKTKNDSYPGKLIVQDIRTVDGNDFKDYDLIIGSPPCNEFSIAKEKAIGAHPDICKRDVEKGLELVREYERVIREAQPRYWAMENVSKLADYYDKTPSWYFMVSKGGKRCLWSNFTIPLSPQFRFKRKIRDIYGWDNTRPLRAKIPYEIARFIADVVKDVPFDAEKGKKE